MGLELVLGRVTVAVGIRFGVRFRVKIGNTWAWGLN